MRVLLTLMLFHGLHGVGAAQPLGDAYWDRMLDKADSVVISRFGAEFFAKHIFPPIAPMDHIAMGDHTTDWENRDTITRTPEYCHFEYDIGFDTLNAGRINIQLNITPEGAVLEDEDLQGFITSPAPVRFRTDLHGFIELARKNGVKCERHTAFRDLRWIPTDTTARLHPGGNGRYELILGRIRKKAMERRIASSTYTYQVVDAIIFDPFTGEVLRKEERQEILSIACGAENL